MIAAITRMWMFSLAIFLLLLCGALNAEEVDMSITQTLKLDQSLLDVALSQDGKWIYVLTENHSVLVFSAEGERKGSLKVDESVDGIRAGREGALLLTSRAGHSVRLATLEFIYDIDISESPAKGADDAPVVVAVFGEFQ